MLTLICMQSSVWFVSACRIWTGTLLWALENEPEQIMVHCTGWKIERTYLAARSQKRRRGSGRRRRRRKKRKMFRVNLSNSILRANPPLLQAHRLFHFSNLHMFIRSLHIAANPWNKHAPLPTLDFTKLRCQPLVGPARHTEEMQRPDKVITTYLRNR